MNEHNLMCDIRAHRFKKKESLDKNVIPGTALKPVILRTLVST